MKNGPFGSFRVVFSALRAWGKVPEGPKIAQKGRFVLVFSRFFCLVSLIFEHAKFSKVNAAEKFGVDF